MQVAGVGATRGPGTRSREAISKASSPRSLSSGPTYTWSDGITTDRRVPPLREARARHRLLVRQHRAALDDSPRVRGQAAGRCAALQHINALYTALRVRHLTSRRWHLQVRGRHRPGTASCRITWFATETPLRRTMPDRADAGDQDHFPCSQASEPNLSPIDVAADDQRPELRCSARNMPGPSALVVVCPSEACSGYSFE
jgi:hypothetical protein